MLLGICITMYLRCVLAKALRKGIKSVNLPDVQERDRTVQLGTNQT